MPTSLPFRSRIRNTARAAAAPSAIHLIATRSTGADCNVVLLTADLADHSFAWAKRHATIVLDAAAARYPGCTVDVQLVDGDNLPLFVATAGGAS